MDESNHEPLTVGIIGAGEMGAAVGQRLREGGARAITTLRGRSPASVERVRRAGLETVDDDSNFVLESDLILSIVPPGQALAVAERYHQTLKGNRGKAIFVECNAVSPATVRQIAELLASDCRFIDAGIIGGPPPAGRLDRGPRFYASGAGAVSLTGLRQHGLDIAVIDGPIGAASALKLSYAGLTKGLIALAAAMIGGATRAGLADALRAELARSQPALLSMIGTRMPAMFPKAHRWVAEMEEIAAFLGDSENGAAIYEGMARLYERVAADWEKGGGGGRLIRDLESFAAAVMPAGSAAAVVPAGSER
jgi:3-hydroxyisobutyrate dehydrogenase-like beta-hydroxyacid dehydrogenase